MPRPSLFFGCSFRAVPHLLLIVLAQTQASLGLGIGTVRYPGGSSIGVASLGPTLSYTAPTLTLNAGGTLAALPQGEWFLLGHSDGWFTTPPLSDGIRLGLEAGWTGSSRTAGMETEAPYAIGELLWAAPDWGVGLAHAGARVVAPGGHRLVCEPRADAIPRRLVHRRRRRRDVAPRDRDGQRLGVGPTL